MCEENIVLNFLVNGEPNSLYSVGHLWLGEESETIRFPWHVPVMDSPKEYSIEIRALPVEGEEVLETIPASGTC